MQNEGNLGSMVPGYIVVKEDFEDEPLELELEGDGNLRMSTLISQFSGACGLRFRNKDTGVMRGVRLHQDLFLPPNGADGWPTDVIFNVVYSKDASKSRPRQSTPETVEVPSPIPRRPTQKPSDLAVLSLPWKTNEQELKKYFGRFGTVVFVNIKKDPETGNSRGFGFIRFETYEAQLKAMEQQVHELEGRNIVLRLTKKGENSQFRKVFVGRLTSDLTRQHLMDYFSQFGTITDITIPQPFRSFAFITFQESGDAIAILDQDHLIMGVSVVTRGADPIQDQNKNNRNNQQYNNTSASSNSNEGFNSNSQFQQQTSKNNFVAQHINTQQQQQDLSAPNPEIMFQVNQALSLMGFNQQSQARQPPPSSRVSFSEQDAPMRLSYAPRSRSPSNSGSPRLNASNHNLPFSSYSSSYRTPGAGILSPPSATASQSIRNLVNRRSTTVSKTEASGISPGWPNNSGYTSSPWDGASDPQSKVFSHGKSWL